MGASIGYLIEKCVNEERPSLQVDIWIAKEVDVEWERKNMETVIVRAYRYKTAIKAFMFMNRR